MFSKLNIKKGTQWHNVIETSAARGGTKRERTQTRMAQPQNGTYQFRNQDSENKKLHFEFENQTSENNNLKTEQLEIENQHFETNNCVFEFDNQKNSTETQRHSKRRDATENKRRRGCLSRKKEKVHIGNQKPENKTIEHRN